MPEQPKNRVLVVEDDGAVRRAVERALSFEGYDVVTARDGAEALAIVLNDSIEAIVLDVMMPIVDGLEACRRIRARGDTTPILILTARTEVSDRVAGLDAGADDYLVKPFALEELLARLRALLRRSSGGVAELMRVGDLVMDTGSRQVHRGDTVIDLTKQNGTPELRQDPDGDCPRFRRRAWGCSCRQRRGPDRARCVPPTVRAPLWAGTGSRGPARFAPYKPGSW